MDVSGLTQMLLNGTYDDQVLALKSWYKVNPSAMRYWVMKTWAKKKNPFKMKVHPTITSSYQTFVIYGKVDNEWIAICVNSWYTTVILFLDYRDIVSKFGRNRITYIKL